MSVLVDQAILDRTMRIQYAQGVGSAFYFEINGVKLIVTAAHLVSGIADGDSIGIRFKTGWVYKKMIRVLPGDPHDICVLMPETQWGEGMPESKLQGGLALGQEVAYCGFPLGLEMEGLEGALGWPKGYVKTGTFSGLLQHKAGYNDFLFDTINNVGFSGGPVVAVVNGERRIVATVSGYQFDAPLPIFRKDPNGSLSEVPEYYVRPNSGFMRAVPIEFTVATARAMLG